MNKKEKILHGGSLFEANTLAVYKDVMASEATISDTEFNSIKERFGADCDRFIESSVLASHLSRDFDPRMYDIGDDIINIGALINAVIGYSKENLIGFELQRKAFADGSLSYKDVCSLLEATENIMNRHDLIFKQLNII